MIMKQWLSGVFLSRASILHYHLFTASGHCIVSILLTMPALRRETDIEDADFLFPYRNGKNYETNQYAYRSICLLIFIALEVM
jgi:hypothetical protein